jgi:hypothetical protein
MKMKEQNPMSHTAYKERTMTEAKMGNETDGKEYTLLSCICSLLGNGDWR